MATETAPEFKNSALRMNVVTKRFYDLLGVAGAIFGIGAYLYLLRSSGSITYLLKIAFMFVVMLAFLARKSAKASDTRAATVAVTSIHVVLPLFLTASGRTENPFLPAIIIAYAGLLVSALSLIDLYDYFSIFPAFRGVQTKGLYSLVRHPIYAGYNIFNFAWLASFPCVRNAAIAAVFLTFTLLRIRREEALLSKSSPDYTKYAAVVRYRLLPWVV